MNDGKTATIRSAPHPDCLVCGQPGHLLYEGLRDRASNAPGTWRLVQCSTPSCGMAWLDPMPIVEDLHLAYQDYYTHGLRQSSRSLLLSVYEWLRRAYFDRGGGPVSLARRGIARLARLHPGARSELDYLSLYSARPPQGRLLDIGCGDGRLLKFFSEIGWQAAGIDPDPLAVEQARKRGLDVRCGTLEEAAFADESFDALTLSHVIEHLPDPRATLTECRRVLKPGGQLVAVTPNLPSLGHARFGQDWMPLEPPRHLYLFSPDVLQELARLAGFAHVRVFTIARLSQFVFITSRQIQTSGRYTIHQGFSLSERFKGRMFHFSEWRRMRVHPHAGEEIVLVATK